MKVIKFPQSTKHTNPVIILGGFSMFHIGHKKLIDEAKKENKKIVLFLFDKPELLPGKTKEIFEQLEVRLQKAANLGIDTTVVLKANKINLFMVAEDFIKKIQEYNPSKIIVGEDYKFGHNAKGNAPLLKKFFNCTIIPTVKVASKKISGSIIKEQIPFGEVKFCNSLMTEPWTTIVKIGPDNKFDFEKNTISPHKGIYAITLELDGMLYHGVISATSKYKQVKLLNLEENLQNKKVVIRWIQELRISIKSGDEIIDEEIMKAANRLFKKNTSAH